VLAAGGVVGDTTIASEVPVGHASVKAVPLTLTDLENVTVIDVLAATSVAPLAGEVELTAGGVSTVLVIVFVGHVGVAQPGVPAFVKLAWLLMIEPSPSPASTVTWNPKPL